MLGIPLIRQCVRSFDDFTMTRGGPRPRQAQKQVVISHHRYELAISWVMYLLVARFTSTAKEATPGSVRAL